MSAHPHPQPHAAPPGEPLPLTLNGQPATAPAGERVAALLERLGLRRDGVAVAINGEVVPRSAWEARPLRAGDRVEVIQAVGGG